MAESAVEDHKDCTVSWQNLQEEGRKDHTQTALVSV